ncbi:hypothetical protein KX729_33075 [Rhizobium sp. XQZ8]|uniref:hypothetical protein n=1 Tax=Rhizobium populisoli TaxID=2859785 RepID=UPI001CA50F22|nr:hypothetical protein [Rhizobium populisoli]MBW6426181.1 hypothetical protein [Rhizobium populisoli]
MLIFKEITMRFSALTIAALVTLSSVALASDPPTKVVLTSDAAAQEFAGTVQQGMTNSFTYTSSTVNAA